MTAGDDFGRTTARAATWAFLSSTGARIVTLVGLALLARLLAPHEFGLLAFALTYIVYVDTIADLGSGTALIYWPDRREDAAQVTFIINVVAGIFWCGITFALAPIIADIFNAPQGTPIVRALSLTFFIKYLGNTHDALMRKDLRFHGVAISEFAQAVVKAVVSLVLAYRGYGAWSLVWGHLAGLLAWSGWLWILNSWRPAWRFPRDLFKPMLQYGRGIVFVNVLAAIQHQTDLLMISRRQGLASLGLYQLAGRIPEATVAMIYRVASDVLLPTFARASASGGNATAVYLGAARYVASATMPVACGLAILSEPFVLLFFGEKWVEAAPIVSALAILSGIRALSAHPGDVLKATGRVGVLARIGFVRTVLIVIAVVIASRWSALAVAVSLVIVDGLALLISFALTTRAIGVSFADIGRALAPSFSSAAVMSAVLFAWMRWGPDLRPAVFEVIVAVALGAIAYLLTLRVTDRQILSEAASIFRRRSTASAQ